MPIAPILMTPAFRYGEMTPWGGNKLGSLFNKAIPDDQTGECLEVSALPGLESCSPEKQTLSELIELYGKRLLGNLVQGDFPLLLKLIDAKDQLSVQVHPDDSYAKLHEGKFGKTEAWVILAHEPGAELVYGLKEGTTREELKTASENGRQVESLLQRVKVRVGDVFYIPAGTVHAIGSGIVLYEIQQSSDVTYRFYDWDRADAKGNKRPLHLEKALDVSDLNTRPSPVAARPLALLGKGKRSLLLSNPFFSLERFENCEMAPMTIAPDRFALLTAIENAQLHYDGHTLNLSKGQSIFLPADGFPLSFSGAEALLSYPGESLPS